MDTGELWESMQAFCSDIHAFSTHPCPEGGNRSAVHDVTSCSYTSPGTLSTMNVSMCRSLCNEAPISPPNIPAVALSLSVPFRLKLEQHSLVAMVALQRDVNSPCTGT